MKNILINRSQNVKSFFLFLALISYNSFVYSAVLFRGSQTSTVTHKTCYSSVSSVSYTANVKNTTNPLTGSYICGTNYSVNLAATKFELRAGANIAGNPVLATNIGLGSTACVAGGLSGANIFGSFNLTAASFPVGIYTIYATVAINDITEGRSKLVYISSVFELGYQAVWSDLVDMQLTPNSYSCNRSVVSASLPYACINSLNQLNALENGWVNVGAQFSTAATGIVYVVLGKTVNVSSFAPTPTSSSFFYLSFNKTSATTGTVSVITNAGTYVLTGLLHTDRVFVERTLGNTVKFYKNSYGTVISGSPILTNTSEWNISTYTAGLNNGSLSVYTSLPCINNSLIFAKLERELKGVNYPCGSKLNFYFNEEYNLNTATALSYRILDGQHKPVQCNGSLCSSTATTVATTRVFGDNRIELNVSALSNASYILEVTNDKKEMFYLRFTKN